LRQTFFFILSLSEAQIGLTEASPGLMEDFIGLMPGWQGLLSLLLGRTNAAGLVSKGLQPVPMSLSMTPFRSCLNRCFGSRRQGGKQMVSYIQAQATNARDFEVIMDALTCSSHAQASARRHTTPIIRICASLVGAVCF
jgi:hypothetical protein